MDTNLPINVCSITDDNFVVGTLVTLYSARKNLDRNRTLHIYILDGGIRPSNKDRMRSILTSAGAAKTEISFVAAEPDKTNHLMPHQGSGMTYLKLHMPRLLPETVKRVLYLDSDLLVQGNAASLWDEDLGEFSLGAVREYASPFVATKDTLPTWQEIGLSPSTPYFNAGVLLMDLDKWRKNKIHEAVLNYLDQYKSRNLYGDQDGINAILKGQWKELPLRWNVPSYLSTVGLLDGLPNSPIKEFGRLQSESFPAHSSSIIHFSGKKKPWILGLGIQPQLSWLRYYVDSEWVKPYSIVERLRILLLRLECHVRAAYRKCNSIFRKGYSL